MDPRWVIAFCLALSTGADASAQQTRNRIDLDVSEAAPLPNQSASPPAISGIAFRPTDVVCPEEHGTIEIRLGQMYLHRRSSHNQVRLTGPGPFQANPLDDETYRYELGNENCRIELHVRLQMRPDGEWRPVPLPYWSRPGLSDEERSARTRELRNLFEEHRERGKTEPKPRPLMPPSPQLLGDAGGIGEAFFFAVPAEAKFEDCFQAVGIYEIGQDGVFFTFLRGLPGNVNRFAIERNDINGFQGRLYFVRGGCRFQVTASGSRKYNSEWAPLVIDNPI